MDTGGAFYYKGAAKIDICMENETETFDKRINKDLTIVFVEGNITCDE
jgi:hypothetical protein